jgi:hypothetical protein
MPEANNKNGVALINQFRSWLADFRRESNAMVDLYQKRIDELEVRLTKEGIAQPCRARIEGENGDSGASGEENSGREET